MEGLAGRVILLWGWRRLLAAFLAGAVLTLAQAPYDFLPAAFVALPVLVWLLDGISSEPGTGLVRRLKPAFATGWWFGFGYFLSGLWWIGQALLVDAEAFAWALPIAVLGLPAMLAAFYGLAAALARLFWSDGISRIAALAAAFGIVEWLRATVLTGFPWNAIGYAAMPVPVLMQSVFVVGMMGVNVLAAFVFSAPALLAAPTHRRTGLVAALVILIAHAGYGFARTRMAAETVPERTLAVRIVQPAIDQRGKWDPQQRESILARLLELTARPSDAGAAVPGLIVWPETSLPYLLTQRPEALVRIGDTLREGQTLLLGAVRGEATGDEARYYNAVVAVDQTGTIIGAADKLHLVPFGEFLPLKPLFEAVGLKTVAESAGGFSPGSRRDLLSIDGLKALPLICYEIIFSDRDREAAAAADFVVNVTNDAWFGDTPGPYQHLRQAQVRAVEWGLPLLRAANNGISAYVDPYGRIVDALALDAMGSLDVVMVVSGRPREPGERPINGLVILLFFATMTCGTTLFMRLRSN